MPQYEINVPGSGTYRVDSPVELTDEQAYAAVQSQIASAGAQPKPTTGILSALGSGFRGGIGQFAEDTGTELGLEGLTKFGQRQQQKAQQGYRPTTEADIEAASQRGLFPELGAYASKAIEPLAQDIGAMGGRFVTPMAAAAAVPFIAPEAGAVAAGAAFVGADVSADIGELAKRRKAAGQPPDHMADIAGGITNAVINAFSGVAMAGPIKGLLGKTAAEQAAALAPKVAAGELTAEAAAKQVSGTLTNIAHSTAENALIGTGMMVGNEAVSRAALGQDLTSPEAMQQYLESTKGALGLAPIFGLAHGIGARRGAVGELNTAEGIRNADVRAQAEADQAKTEAQAAAAEQQRTQSPEYAQQAQATYQAEQQKYDDLKSQLIPKPQTEIDKQRNAAVVAQLKEQYKTLKTAAAEALRSEQFLPKTPEAPAAEAPAAPTVPEAPKPDLYKSMEQHDLLTKQLDTLKAQAADAAQKQDTGAVRDLSAQIKDLQGRMEQSSQQIESLGGTTQTPEGLETQHQANLSALDSKIDSTKKKMLDATQGEDFDAASQHATTLDELQAQRSQQIQDYTQRVNALRGKVTSKGETIGMFTEKEAPAPKEAEVAKEETPAEVPAPAKEEKGPVQQELFGEYNILNTALQNKDEPTIKRMTQAYEQKKLQERNKTRDQEKADNDKLIKSLDDRLNLEGTKVKRTEMAGDDYNRLLEKIQTERDKIEKPQGNARISVLDRLYELADEHGKLQEKIDSPTTSAKDKAYAQRRMGTLAKEYARLVETRVEPAKQKVIDLHKRFRTIEPAKSAETLRAEKKAESDRLAREAGEKGPSPEAKRAARINAGDIRYEVEKSKDFRDLSVLLGQEHPDFKPQLAEVQKRLKALRDKYGPDDKAVAEYKQEATKQLGETAKKLGRSTPEYKETLKQRLEDMRESLASAGKQEVKSKRTTQETRTVRRAPRELGKQLYRDFEEGIASEKNGPAVYQTRESSGPAMREEEVKRFITRIVQDWKKVPNIVFARNFDALPENIKAQARADNMEGKIPGVYDPATKTAYIVGDKMHTAEDVIATVAHEVTGHFGLREVLGEEYNSKMNELYDGNNEVRKRADEKLKASDAGEGPKLNKEVAVEEVLAEMAENPKPSPEERGAVRKIIDDIKEWFKKTFKGQTLSDEAVRQIVADARQYVIEGTERGKGEAPAGKAAYRTAKYDPKLKEAGDLAEKVIATDRPLHESMTASALGRKALELEVKLVDQFAPIARLAKKMDQLAGTQMMYYLRMAQQRTNLLGQVVGRGVPELRKITRPDGRTEYLYETKDKNNSLVNVAKTLEPANKLTGSPEATNNLFSLYEVAQRAKDVGLEKLDYSGKITQAQLDSAMRQIASVPGLENIFKNAKEEYRRFNQDMIKFGVSTGQFSKELGAKMMANKDYVPYYRENSDGSVSLMMGNESITKVGNVKDKPYLHELVGDDSRVVDFATSSVRNANMILEMGLNNQAIKNTAFELQKIGLADVRKGKTTARGNVLNFKVDGEDHYAIVKDTDEVPAELLVKGMEGMPIQPSALMRLVGAPSRLIRTMFVANPVSAGRILFKDTISSAMVAGSDFKGMADAIKNVKSDLMERRGLSGGEVYTGLPDDLTNILKKVQAGGPNWEKLLAKGYELHGKADAMTRQIRYESYLKQGLSEMEASYMALESMNFTRRGISPSLHVLNAINPFMNSQIQGINTLVKALRGNMPMEEKLQIKQKIIQRGMMLAGASMVYAAMMQDDETYKNALPEQKYNNFFVPFPGVDEMVRVPIPFEAGIVFKSLPEAVMNYIYGHDKEAATAIRMMAQKLLPGGDTDYVPQILKPAIEVGLGKSFYTGRDIESKHEQSLTPGMRVRDSTSGFAAELGSALNISPVKIDHLISGYTGSMGLAVAQMASSLVFGPQNPNEPEKNLSREPIVGTLFQPKDAGNIVEEAYQTMTEAEQVRATVADLLKKNKPDEAKAFLDKNAEAFARGASAGSFNTVMRNYQTQMQAVTVDPNLTPEQKRTRLEELRAKRTEYAEKMQQMMQR